MADSNAKTGATLYLDTTSAQAALGKLNTAIDAYDARLKNTKLTAQESMAIDAKRSAAATQAAQIQTRIEQGLGATYKEQQKYVQDLTNQVKGLAVGTEAYGKKVADLRSANSVFDEMKAKIKGVQEAQDKATQSSTQFGRVFTRVAEGLAAYASITAVLGQLKAIVSISADFQKSVANLSAITGATGADLVFLKNAAIDMSKSSTNSAKDFVEAMKLIASAKPELLTQKEALVEVTKASNLLADASGLALPDAAKRLTDALNQFGEPASKAGKYVDALAAASKYGAAEVPEITDALLQFGTQAKSANISIFESSAVIELLAEKGIKGAEAGTKLRNVFLTLNAVAALPKEGREALERYGVNTEILSDKTLSLQQRLSELGKISGDSAALVKVFGKENFNAAQIVLQNIPRYAELAGQIKETGVASQQAMVNTDTLTAAWARFTNTLNANFLKSGGFADYLRDIVKGITGIIEPTQTATEKFNEQQQQRIDSGAEDKTP